MRAVTWAEVFESVCTMAGLDPDTLQTMERNAIKRSIARAARHVWEACAWPELLEVEQRYWRAQWVETLAYDVGAEVWFNDRYWRATGAAAAGQGPATAPQLWEELIIAGGVV